MRYQYLVPTSDPELLVTQEGRLLHRELGPLKYGIPRYGPVALPDGRNLQVYWDAPQIEIDIEPVEKAARSLAGTSDAGAIVTKITEFMGNASNYITVATTAIQVLDLLMDAVDETEARLAAIYGQPQTLAQQIGASDYLARLRRMADMRANALTIVHNLDALRTLIVGSSPAAWYQHSLNEADLQLQRDIFALLDPGGGYFRRVYSEQAITGDGGWMTIIPERPVDSQGTTFDYRMTLPTLTFLIAVRVAMMKFVVPDFVSRHVFTSEIQRWFDSLRMVEQWFDDHVKATNPMPINLQCYRRQTYGHQRIGDFQNWNRHCTIAPPYSISPIGAVDISTGFGIIDWDYIQFDEWYLGQGDLHGATAGYWPPSIGPQLYRPPAAATGLPPLEKAIDDYYSMARRDAGSTRIEVLERIGEKATRWLRYHLFELGYGQPFPGF